MAPGAGGSADQLDQSISRRHRIGCGARVASGTGAVEFARSNAGNTNARTFLAPYRPISVPYCFRGASEGLTIRHNHGREKKKR